MRINKLNLGTMLIFYFMLFTILVIISTSTKLFNLSEEIITKIIYWYANSQFLGLLLYNILWNVLSMRDRIELGINLIKGE